MENFDMKAWCQLLKDAPVEKMDEELTMMMMNIMMGGVNREKMDEVFTYKVAKSRAEHIGLIADQQLLDFLVMLCPSPGDIVMYLSLLRQEQLEGKTATMENFCYLFPFGFPNRDELGVIWDAQKVKGASLGNGLDSYDWSLV